MTDVSMFTLIFSGIWCLVGLIFLGTGLFLRRVSARREERMRTRAGGKVVEVVRRAGANGVGWYPIVEFEADGRRVSLESQDGGGAKRFYEGQSVEVLYDPDDPTRFRLEGLDIIRLVGTIFLWVGLVAIAVGLVAALIINRLNVIAR